MGTISHRKDGRWEARLVVELPSGQKQRLVAYAKKESDAIDALRKLHRRADRGDVAKKERLTVELFLSRWIADAVRTTVRPATLRSYTGVIRNHVVPVIGTVQLARLSSMNVQHMMAQLETKGISPRTRELTLVVLRAALDKAAAWNLVDRNVAARGRVEKPRVARSEMSVWTPVQVLAFLEAARGDRLASLYFLALSSGMRQGELFALRWEDVDLDGGTIAVEHTLEPTSRSLAEPKSRRGRRLIELPPSTITELREHRKGLLEEGHPHGYVFPDRTGRPLRGSNVLRRSFIPLVALADATARAEAADYWESPGVPLIRFHDLRHTAATLMLAAGVHPKIVQERLGHATIAITLDTYSHVLPSMQRDAALAIERFFLAAGTAKLVTLLREGREP